jgi:hypothetical protein
VLLSHRTLPGGKLFCAEQGQHMLSHVAHAHLYVMPRVPSTSTFSLFLKPLLCC